MKWLLISICLIITVASLFFLGHTWGSAAKESSGPTASQILDQAKRETTPPPLPPQPVGHVVIARVERTVQLPQAKVVATPQKIGPLVAFNFPKAVVAAKPATQVVETPTLVGPSTAETAAWNAKVKKLQENYQKSVSDKAQQIAQKAADDKSADALAEFNETMKDSVVPLITAISGLIGAIAALRWGPGGKPKPA